MELELRAVVVVGGPHRAHDRDVVDTITHVGPPIAHFDAALGALAVADLHGVELRPHVSARYDLLDVPANQRRGEGVFVGRFGDALAAVLVDGGLGVKAFDVADTADHEDPDDAFGFGLEVRLAVGAGPRFARWCSPRRPSRWSMAPRTRPVRPMPVSARKVRRLTPQQAGVMSLVSLDMAVLRYTIISLIGRPKSMSSRLRPGTSSLRGSRPSKCSTVACASVT